MNDSLKAIVAELLAVAPDQVGSDRALSGGRLQGSLGRAVLDASIRRKLGVQNKACYTAKTFGELEAALNGNAIATVETTVPMVQQSIAPSAPKAPPMFTTAPVNSPQQSQGNSFAGCGVDIEQIENLPVALDYWSNEFYTTNFTPAEIAYCLTQQSPAPHFAARWCAKEALKKCESSLLDEEMKNIEVVTRADGSPSLRHHANGHSTLLPHSLSLSHTDRNAVAMVVFASVPPPIPNAPAIAVPSPQQVVPEVQPQSRVFEYTCSLLAVALAIIAIAIAALKH